MAEPGAPDEDEHQNPEAQPPPPNPPQTYFQRWNPLRLDMTELKKTKVIVTIIVAVVSASYYGITNLKGPKVGKDPSTLMYEQCLNTFQKFHQDHHSICETVMHQKYEENRECIFSRDTLNGKLFKMHEQEAYNLREMARLENKLGSQGEKINQLESENLDLKIQLEKLKVNPGKWQECNSKQSSWFSSWLFSGNTLFSEALFRGFGAAKV